MSTLSDASLNPLALGPQESQPTVVVTPPEKPDFIVGEVAIRLADLPRWRPTINLDDVKSGPDDD